MAISLVAVIALVSGTSTRRTISPRIRRNRSSDGPTRRIWAWS